MTKAVRTEVPVMTCAKHLCRRTAPGGYCPPRRCYCGSCPHYVPFTAADSDRASVISNLIAARRKRRGPR